MVQVVVRAVIATVSFVSVVLVFAMVSVGFSISHFIIYCFQFEITKKEIKNEITAVYYVNA